MKEDIDLLIENKWRKRDEFDTFIAAIEKLPRTQDIKLAIYQGKDFINVYNNFFNNHYARCIKEILTISI